MRSLLFAPIAIAVGVSTAAAEEPSPASSSKATVLAAQVDGTSSGAELRMKMGAKSVKRISAGVYQIKFKQRVDVCFPTATMFYPGASISAQPQFEKLKDTMIVAIKNSAGEFVDDRFWLVVNCPG